MCVNCAYTIGMTTIQNETKAERLHVRLSPSDDRLIRQAARTENVNLSSFVTQSARKEAMRVLNERTSTVISAAEWDALEARLAEPGIFKPEVARLFAKSSPFDS